MRYAFFIQWLDNSGTDVQKHSLWELPCRHIFCLFFWALKLVNYLYFPPTIYFCCWSIFFNQLKETKCLWHFVENIVVHMWHAQYDYLFVVLQVVVHIADDFVLFRWSVHCYSSFLPYVPVCTKTCVRFVTPFKESLDQVTIFHRFQVQPNALSNVQFVADPPRHQLWISVHMGNGPSAAPHLWCYLLPNLLIFLTICWKRLFLTAVEHSNNVNISVADTIAINTPVPE